MKNWVLKTKLKRNFLFVLGIVFSFSFFINSAKAEDRIDVEYPVGTNLNGDEIFNAENIYPGWEDSKTIRVENDSEDEEVDLYFTFDVNGDKTLANKLKLYVIRVEDDSYRIGGEGDRQDLEDADDEELYVDRLSPTKGKEYRVKIKFDEDAGNEFQGLEAKFDIDFEIESESAATQTEEEILAGQGRSGFTGEAPVEEGDEGVEEEATVQGEQEGGADDINVGGVGDECRWWPLWVWVVALIIFAGIFIFSLFYKFKEQKEGQYPRRFTPAVLVVAVLAFWHFFDKCDEHRWFAITSAIGAAVVYLIYLYMFKKAVSSDLHVKEDVKIESSSSEEVENNKNENS